MSLWRQLKHALRVLADRGAADRDLDEEARQFFEEQAASWEAAGLSPQEARRSARLKNGSALAIREQVRDGGWESRISNLWRDCRHAFRRLARDPGFTAAALLTLALGDQSTKIHVTRFS